MEIPNYYAILPAVVRYHPDLTPNAKLLYAEITALCNKTGECWATNKYFSELYGVDDRTISRWVDSLVKAGLLKMSLDQSTGNVRTLFPIGAPDKNVGTPIDKNVYHNNTSKNNTRGNSIILRVTNPKGCGEHQCERILENGKPCSRMAVLTVDGKNYCGQHTRIFAQDEIRKQKADQGKMMAVSTKSVFVEEKFEEFWKGYLPVHTGKGAKSVAKTKFLNAVKKKNNPDDIIAGMKRYIAFCHSNNCYTQNVPTFLNQEHWKDYLVEEKDSKGAFVNSFPISVTPSTLNKEEILDVIKTHLQTWTQENPVWTERIKAISAKAKDESDLFHTQKSLQMALELAKEIFRYKDSPGVRNSLVDPLFWLSCRSCFSDLEIQASCSGFLYVGYQLRKLAESD